MAFLASDEIKRLLDACVDSQSPSLLIIAKVCLATGARWSEAENLQGHQLSKYRITYTKTKGKKTELYRYLRSCMTNSPKTEGSYSHHAEKPLSVQ